MFAQIGLGDPTGGILVLLVVGVLTLAGLVMCVLGGVFLARARGSRNKPLLILFLGLVLASPVLWLAYEIFEEDLPRDLSWDFSSSRDVAQLRAQKQQDYYYYQGNLRTTVTLPANKQWSGSAYLVVFKAKGGKITDMHWQSKAAHAAQAYGGAKHVLIGLKLPERELDAWYNKILRREQASYTFAARSDPEYTLEVQVRGTIAEENWVVHVNVTWK